MGSFQFSLHGENADILFGCVQIFFGLPDVGLLVQCKDDIRQGLVRARERKSKSQNDSMLNIGKTLEKVDALKYNSVVNQLKTVAK